MTTDEREALLKLWEDVPGCKPGNLYLEEHCSAPRWFNCEADGELVLNDHAAAIARDAMVGWLLRQQPFLCLSAAGADGSPERAGHCKATLLALIAACRRVAGKEE